VQYKSTQWVTYVPFNYYMQMQPYSMWQL